VQFSQALCVATNESDKSLIGFYFTEGDFYQSICRKLYAESMISKKGEGRGGKPAMGTDWGVLNREQE